MPRPTRTRTSLLGHARAAKPTAKAQDDVEMELEDAAPAVEEPSAFEEEPARPAPKQKKADKQYAKREALLAKITAGQNPYSKSHNRRLKRAAQPSNNLVTSLSEVEDVLEQVTAQAEEEEQEQEEEVFKATTGGKGKEKLTAKKRQRVLTSEAARLPAVMANPAFTANPFETIRLHTLNNLKAQQEAAAANKKGKGNKAK